MMRHQNVQHARQHNVGRGSLLPTSKETLMMALSIHRMEGVSVCGGGRGRVTGRGARAENDWTVLRFKKPWRKHGNLVHAVGLLQRRRRAPGTKVVVRIPISL